MPWTICVRCTYCALSTRAHLLLTFIDFAQVAKIWNEGSQNPARTPDSRADLSFFFLHQRRQYAVDNMRTLHVLRTKYTCASATQYSVLLTARRLYLAFALRTFIDFAQDAKIWNEGSQNPARTPRSRADLSSSSSFFLTST